MDQSVLKIRNLTKTYPTCTALDDISLTLPKGKIIGLLGPNGSGKTTLLKLIAGLLKPTCGSIEICSHSIGTETKALVSYLPDRIFLHANQNISQLLNYYQNFFADFDRNRAEIMLKHLDIFLNDKFGNLSKGNQEKVQLILTMSRRARLYLLDEPIGGVDPATRDYILNAIVTNYELDSTILIATHLIADVEKFLDAFLFIEKGCIICQDDADKVRAETGKSLDNLFREVFQCS